ncbi:MAG: ATP-dependent RecD-like DNA helicase [Erysipelotrichaceae bacterium]|nr:ATP-dependent RecD-like DNA helicase [Erysipelotrichaceae bacterium]
MDENKITLNGKFTYILFRSEESLYTVGKFRINDERERSITVTGIMDDVRTDILYNLTGNYVEHPRYGMQFAIETYQIPLPDEKDGIVRYLSGIQFAGIGRKTAEKIVDALGEGCLNLLKEDINVLRTVPGITDKQFAAIEEGMKKEDDGLEELVRFLNIHGVGIRNLVRLNKAYGKNALEKIRENPYRVIEEVDGFGFATADKIGLNLGIAADDERRLYALLVDSCMELCVTSGNSFARLESLEAFFAKKAKGLSYDFGELLDTARKNITLIVEDNRVYPATQHEAEKNSSRFLAGFPYQDLEEYEEEQLAEYLDEIQDELQIEYDEIQKKAILELFHSPLMIMTGGPGTGKTTVVRAMVNLFAKVYPSASIMCAAPTGRAAKRLSELTGKDAATIHSILKWDLETNTFGRNGDEPLNADLLIIDEFSMVDVWLFYNLLKACVNVRRICIIGDENQLPSVGPGCVLRDLIASECFPVIRLKHIYRQEEGSGVISLAHDINTGEIENRYSDTAFFEIRRQDIRQAVLDIASDAVSKGYSLDDIQVLSPMYQGAAGIDVLNNALQEFFNPTDDTKNEVRVGYTVFREGDKILQLKNQPDDDVYNGDIGQLVEIIDARHSENRKTTLICDFQGIFVEYTQDNWNNITLAYCISVHKSQGSEYPIVIFPVTYQMGYMLQRRLIYTAVTRARKAIIVLGELGAFRKGCEILDRAPRETTLKDRIRMYLKPEGDDESAGFA